jgi:hypothetical protein
MRCQKWPSIEMRRTHTGLASTAWLAKWPVLAAMGTETNPFAIAANFITYLSCAIGRGVYLPIGNTWHHNRIFCLHIGRSGRGRKGDAVQLVLRIDQALRELDIGLHRRFTVAACPAAKALWP